MTSEQTTGRLLSRERLLTIAADHDPAPDIAELFGHIEALHALLGEAEAKRNTLASYIYSTQNPGDIPQFVKAALHAAQEARP